MKRDEAVLKKAMEENSKLKREVKRGAPVTSRAPPAKTQSLDMPNADDFKDAFMDKLTSKLELMFDDESEIEQVAQDTQNSTIDDKEKMLSAVRSNVDQLKQDLGDLL